MFCNNCGNKVSDSAKFCPKCGTKLHGRQSSSHPNTHYQVAQTNTDQQNENSEQGDDEQQAPQKAQGHKVKLYMKELGVGFIISGIGILLAFQLKIYQMTITLFGIIPIDRPIWGVSLIIFGVGLLAVGSIK